MENVGHALGGQNYESGGAALQPPNAVQTRPATYAERLMRFRRRLDDSLNRIGELTDRIQGISPPAPPQGALTGAPVDACLVNELEKLNLTVERLESYVDMLCNIN